MIGPSEIQISPEYMREANKLNINLVKIQELCPFYNIAPLQMMRSREEW